MNRCPGCEHDLEIQSLSCPACGIVYSGRFRRPRLARLPAEMQHLVEELIVAETNLKEAAERLEISFPTLRKRLDALVEAMKQLREQDAAAERALLRAVDDGSLRPEEAARQIKELHGGL